MRKKIFLGVLLLANAALIIFNVFRNNNDDNNLENGSESNLVEIDIKSDLGTPFTLSLYRDANNVYHYDLTRNPPFEGNMPIRILYGIISGSSEIGTITPERFNFNIYNVPIYFGQGVGLEIDPETGITTVFVHNSYFIIEYTKPTVAGDILQRHVIASSDGIAKSLLEFGQSGKQYYSAGVRLPNFRLLENHRMEFFYTVGCNIEFDQAHNLNGEILYLLMIFDGNDFKIEKLELPYREITSVGSC